MILVPSPMNAEDDRTRADDADPEDEDFARMLEASLEPLSFEPGQTVEGRIVAVDEEVAFVDVGGKARRRSTSGFDRSGRQHRLAGRRHRPGGRRFTAGGLSSRTARRGAATRQQLHDAFRSRLPVEGRVEGVNRGGYEVRVAGQRAFCPLSQIDTAFTNEPAVHVGRVYTFRIVEYKEDGKDLIVSRRALLEEEEREHAEEVRRTIVPGAVLPGASCRSCPTARCRFGGGNQGLIHVSEWAGRAVRSPQIVNPATRSRSRSANRLRKGKIALD